MREQLRKKLMSLSKKELVAMVFDSDYFRDILEGEE